MGLVPSASGQQASESAQVCAISAHVSHVLVLGLQNSLQHSSFWPQLPPSAVHLSQVFDVRLQKTGEGSWKNSLGVETNGQQSSADVQFPPSRTQHSVWFTFGPRQASLSAESRGLRQQLLKLSSQESPRERQGAHMPVLPEHESDSKQSFPFGLFSFFAPQHSNLLLHTSP